MSKKRGRKRMVGVVLVSLLSLLAKQEASASLGRNWPPTGGGRGESSIGIEEYASKEDYTGWLHVTVRVLDGERKPLEGMYVVLRKADGSGEAGHGPSINGTLDYKTDEKGELLFRIYPNPVSYNVIVPKQDKWGEKEEGPYVIAEDFQTIEVVLEEEKEDNGEEDGGGDNNGDNGGNNNGDNGGNNNGDNGGNNNGDNGGNNNGDNGGNNSEDNGGSNDDGNSGGNNNGNNNNGNNNNGNVVENSDGTNEPADEIVTESNPADTNGNQESNQESSVEEIPQKPEEIVLPAEEPSEEKDREVMFPGPDQQMDTKDDILIIPDLGKNEENNSSLDSDGNMKLPDGGVIIFQTDPDKGDVMIKVPDGSKVDPDGTIHLPEGGSKELMLPGKDASLETKDDVWLRPYKGENGTDNSILHRDGSVLLVDGGRVTYLEDGTEVEVPKGTVILADGTIIYPTSAVVGRIPVAACRVHWAETSGILVVVLFGLWRIKQLDRYLGIYKRNPKKEEVREEDEG